MDDIEGFTELAQLLLRGVVVLRGVLGAGGYGEVMTGLVGFVVVEVVDDVCAGESPAEFTGG